MESTDCMENSELLAPIFASKGEEEVDVLWSANLPPEEETNPALWNALLSTFREALVAVTSPKGLLIFSEKDALDRLKWQGRTPTCGKRILQELRRQRDIVPSPKCDPLVSMTHTGQPKRTQLSLWQRTKNLFGYSREEPTDFCMAKSLQDRAAIVKEAFDHTTKSDSLKTIAEIAEEHCNGNVAEAICISAYLAKTYHWSIAEISPAQYGLKSGSEKLTESDLFVLKTRALFSRLTKQEEKLVNAAEYLFIEAKKVMLDPKLSKAYKDTKATSLLKQRKFTQSRVTTVQQMALNVQKVLSSIDEAHSSADYVSCMEQSSVIIRETQLDVERVDLAMLEMEDVWKVQTDINNAIQQSTAIDPETEKELLEELHQLEETAVSEPPKMQTPMLDSTFGAKVEQESPPTTPQLEPGNLKTAKLQAHHAESHARQPGHDDFQSAELQLHRMKASIRQPEHDNLTSAEPQLHRAEVTVQQLEPGNHVSSGPQLRHVETPARVALTPISEQLIQTGKVDSVSVIEAEISNPVEPNRNSVQSVDGKMEISSTVGGGALGMDRPVLSASVSATETETQSLYPQVTTYVSNPSTETSLHAETQGETGLEHALESLCFEELGNSASSASAPANNAIESDPERTKADAQPQMLPG
eukprot:Plantae.Rhodophyta-Purpureofilum_apyrenoidigerum.ctg23450.p1 GENE.Plantae.Rhodophyta-Purpureofilum_apyrenoidigerum.ctg23450~~Plantae.Rhodophyta-Purpureofilum_apyrenoidigerum.ctg23450.p1  ORF type:complete len:644 (-),score=107.87 Plantae.Rhodophyta-Purpureofilum_apyrenoidigerum.ctg23450:59-1990(-)